MRWRRMRRTPDVIDQRAARPGRARSPFPLPGGAKVGVPGGLGLVGLLIFLAIQLLGGGSSAFDVDSGFTDPVQAPAPDGSAGIPPAQDPERDLKDFSAYVFAKGQDTWEDAFREQGAPYRSFYRDMSRELGAEGDFAWAYVIAHELGHHAQQQLGTSKEVQQLRAESPDDSNELSVRLELQADCYAGVWAHTVYRAGDLEEGDVEEAVTASAAVGDDRLQRRSAGQVDPDTFTHGSSEQRTKWFRVGQERGEPEECDTFRVDEP
jgi:predicted metalloprotease